MLEKYNLYIGSNNQTKEFELSKIESITSRYFESFTITMSIGYWNESKENTAIVTIATPIEERPTVYKLAKHLKDILNQESIMIEITNPNFNFI